MYTYFKGILISASPTHIVLEVNGVGYSIFIPCRIIGELPPLGETIQVHTSFVVRELSQTLYGFLNNEERDIFEILLNITGIGPKLALSLIGHLTLVQLQSAVASQDFPMLCRVPGVGKKTAERLVVELKDKLSQLFPSQIEQISPSLSSSISKTAQDAVMALIHLGYHQLAAQKAIKESLKSLPDSPDLALLITTALKVI